MKQPSKLKLAPVDPMSRSGMDVLTLLHLFSVAPEYEELSKSAITKLVNASRQARQALVLDVDLQRSSSRSSRTEQATSNKDTVFRLDETGLEIQEDNEQASYAQYF